MICLLKICLLNCVHVLLCTMHKKLYDYYCATICCDDDDHEMMVMKLVGFTIKLSFLFPTQVHMFPVLNATEKPHKNITVSSQTLQTHWSTPPCVKTPASQPPSRPPPLAPRPAVPAPPHLPGAATPDATGTAQTALLCMQYLEAALAAGAAAHVPLGALGIAMLGPGAPARSRGPPLRLPGAAQKVQLLPGWCRVLPGHLQSALLLVPNWEFG